jgi:NAD(P)-dependent dehydrogenase (short-subunit alcohol dehydrogenase family)
VAAGHVNKVFLITGCSSGVGRATALHLDRRGFRVFAGVRKDEDAASLASDASSRLTPVMVDVADADSIDACLQRVREETTDGLAGLVNNAGIAVYGPMESVPLDELRNQLEINVVGQVAMTQAFLPLIRKASGRLVFVSSIAGRTHSMPFFGPYSASKWALEAIADALRVELAPWDIKVSLIEPGAVESEIWSKGFDEFEDVIGRSGPDTRPTYEASLRRGLKIFQMLERRGRPAMIVAKKIDHALNSRRPRPRYVIGPDARFQVSGNFMPDRVRDKVISKTLGVDKPR